VIDPDVRRATPGHATGGQGVPDVTSGWLQGTRMRVDVFPGQIARLMRGMRFNNWTHFRRTFWRLVANDPRLSSHFSKSNQTLMRRGYSPFVIGSEATGGRANAVYQINHRTPISHGGGVYDIDNLEIVTPRSHVGL
jgi:hypothetical protein